MERIELFNDQTEKWLPVIGYEGCYEVSNLGRVKSVRRTVRSFPRNRTVPSRILRQSSLRGGYLSVGLWKNHLFKRVTVHRIVAQAFIPNPKKLPQVNHVDGNKLHNRVDNLEWCSREQNMQHAYTHGLTNPAANFGDTSRGLKLTNKTTNEVYEFKSRIAAAKFIDAIKYKSVLISIYRALSARYPDYKSVRGYYVENL